MALTVCLKQAARENWQSRRDKRFAQLLLHEYSPVGDPSTEGQLQAPMVSTG